MDLTQRQSTRPRSASTPRRFALTLRRSASTPRRFALTLRRPASTPRRFALTGRLSAFLLRWAMLVVFGAIWQAAALRSDSPFFPPMTDILVRARELWLSGPASSLFLSPEATADLVPSLGRLLAGWVIAVIAGVGFGLLLGLSRTAGDYVEPVVHFLRAIPPPALIPLFLILFGIGDGMKVALIAFSVVWIILLNTMDGARSVDEVQLDTGRVFGIDRLRRLTHIVLPSALPKIFAALRISLAVALILMVISEMMASTNGVGFAILSAQRRFRLLDMWAGILLLSVLGYVLNTLLVKIEGRVLAWHRGAHGNENP